MHVVFFLFTFSTLFLNYYSPAFRNVRKKSIISFKESLFYDIIFIHEITGMGFSPAFIASETVISTGEGCRFKVIAR